MDVYLDLTLLMNLIIYSFIFLYLHKLSNIKLSMTKKVFIILFLILKYFFIPVIDSKISFFFYIYDIVILMCFINKKKMYTTILFIFLYYIFSTFFMFIEPHILYFKHLLIISSPSAIFKLIFMPIPLFLGFYALNLLKNKYVHYKYSYQGQLKYLDQIVSLTGYLDSGNTLKINGIPVIFIKSNLGLTLSRMNRIDIEYITVNGIKNKQVGYEGKVALKVKNEVIIKKVIFSIVKGEHSFHDCDCLLNAHLF